VELAVALEERRLWTDAIAPLVRLDERPPDRGDATGFEQAGDPLALVSMS
jgi:hypothetical protein